MQNKTKIAIVIPDRGDRPKFLEHCFKMIERQTRQPDIIELVNDEPAGPGVDITRRYRIGFDRALKKGAELVFLWENDDWYREDYLQLMTHIWQRNGRPYILGIGYTIYYHIINREYIRLEHPMRASAMNTVISKAGIERIKYPADSEPFLDLHLWSQLKGKTISPEIISVGIKHNTGLCGGKAHKDSFQYNKADNALNYLRSIVDQDSYKFYENYVQ